MFSSKKNMLVTCIATFVAVLIIAVCSINLVSMGLNPRATIYNDAKNVEVASLES